MGETGGGEGVEPYNYSHFDGYVAASGDVADEAAFWGLAPRGSAGAGFQVAAAGRW